MIFGFVLLAVGYSVLYWGIHHFPGVDCPGSDPNACRYSLVDLLGLHGLVSPGKPVQFK